MLIKLIAVALCLTTFLNAQDLEIRTFKGQAIAPYVNDITCLTLIIYREYPYLYEGTAEEYGPFIQYYADFENSVAAILFDHDKPVGVAIGMPIQDMRDKYKEPLLNFDPSLENESLFYLGELLLLKDYRGKGWGKKMYLALEQEAKRQNNKICFCQIEDWPKHPQRPVFYQPLNEFWYKLGFEPIKDFSFSVSWRNISESEESSHQMYYWIKTVEK